jgi:hypothetical protein
LYFAGEQTDAQKRVMVQAIRPPEIMFKQLSGSSSPGTILMICADQACTIMRGCTLPGLPKVWQPAILFDCAV